jgi:signal peptidase II
LKKTTGKDKMHSRIIAVLTIALLVSLADQGSKWLILNHVMVPPQVISVTRFFNLTLGFNTGVSFGIGRDYFGAYPVILALFKVTVASGLMILAVLTPSRLECSGLSLIAGGALGNAVDRWLQGAVTDFLDIHWEGWHWPTFNMADVAISLGVFLILLAVVQPPQTMAKVSLQ